MPSAVILRSGATKDPLYAEQILRFAQDADAIADGGLETRPAERELRRHVPARRVARVLDEEARLGASGEPGCDVDANAIADVIRGRALRRHRAVELRDQRRRSPGC